MATSANVSISVWKLHILHINMLGRRFDYKKTWKTRLPRIVSYINAVNPDVVTGVECQKLEAEEISNKTGLGFVNYLGSTIFYRKGLSVRVLKKFSWLKNYPHSALVVELKDLKTGKTVNIAASHLPPFSYRAKLRKSQQKLLCNLFNGWNDASIICTDANWSKTFESYTKSLGWVSARLNAVSKYMANYKTSSALKATQFKPGNPIDYVISKRGKKSVITMAYYSVGDGRGLSDHNPVEVIALISSPSISNL